MGDAVEVCEPETQVAAPVTESYETQTTEVETSDPSSQTDTSYCDPNLYGPMTGVPDEVHANANELDPNLVTGVPDEVHANANEPELDPMGQSVPADAARTQLESLEAMSDADKTAALKTMPPEDIKQMMVDLPEEERVRLVELAKHSDNPETKLDLFMAGQRAKVNQDANADLSQDMDAELATQMEERRKKIAESTMKELEEEEARLREKGTNMSEQDVKDMIARKTKEHDIEMGYNVNLTATGEIRSQSVWDRISGEAPGALDGKRVEWTKDELDVLDRALRQAPDGTARNNPNLEEIQRHEDIGANADHDPRTKTIRIADPAISNGQGYIDPSGVPGIDTDDDGNLTKREDNSDPTVRAEGGEHSTFMEWVVLHELGHNQHDFESKEAFEEYEKNMMVHEVAEDDLEHHLDEDNAEILEDGEAGTRVKAYGFTYVKQKDGSVKKFPSQLYEKSDADPDAKEYFAQHHNQAILAPESTAVEYLDKPQERLKNATESLGKANDARKDLVAAGGDTTELDARIAALEEEQRAARINERVWKKEYTVMRDKVFHTEDAETDARQRMIDDGYDTAEFDRLVERVSTPDQVARLEEQMRRDQDGGP